RKRTFLTCTVALLVSSFARTCVVDAESLGRLPDQDLLRAHEEGEEERGAEELEHITDGRLPSRMLKCQLQRCLIAARAGLPVPPSLQAEPAPYYGVLLSLQSPPETRGTRVGTDWRIACTAQGLHQLATAQDRLFPSPLLTGSAPFPSEMLLPSWASFE